MSGYTVHRNKHGVFVVGAIPASDLVGLVGAWTDEGFTHLDAGIASAVGATLAVTSEESGAAWRAEIAAANATTDAARRWLRGTDTGMSSLTLFCVLAEGDVLGEARSRMRFAPSIPYDPDDFGRCHRLLEAVPEWRARLHEVAAKHPKWAKLVEAWPELTALYLEETPTGEAPRLYQRMGELEGRWE
jgi:hypothetical protein